MKEPTKDRDAVDDLRTEPVLAVEEEHDAVVVRLAGELDLYAAPAVRAALAEAVGRATARVVVDLSEVTFVDSTALGVLIEARKSVAGARTFAVAAPGPETRRTLQVSGLDRHLGVHDTLAEALGSS